MIKEDKNPSALGQLLQGRYLIIQVLNAGAFGQTYIAEDISQPSPSRCVLKQYKLRSNHPNPLSISRRLFLKETMTLETVSNHPQIPSFLDSFEEETGFYLVLELIEGNLLSSELPTSPSGNPCWNETQCVTLLKDILDILHFIHKQGIIHCDLKPNNIIRRAIDSKLILIDFGAAQTIRQNEDLRLNVVASPNSSGYLTVEQLAGQPQPSSDIYALGMIAIEALTGISPLNLPVDLDTGEVIWHSPLINEKLSYIINKMVKKSYKDRYLSAKEILYALQPLLRTSKSNQSIQLNKNQVKLEDRKTPLEPGIVALLPEKLPIYPRKISPTVVTGIGVGLTTYASVIGFGVHSLLSASPDPGLDILAVATQEYEAGNLQKAITLAISIPSDSSAYSESKSVVSSWRNDWEVAEKKFQVIEKAFNQGQWQNVLKLARDFPNVPYWQKQVETLKLAAKSKLENQAQQLLNKAYKEAIAKDFTTALDSLQDISEESLIYPKVQQKLTEYSQKQRIRANALLQDAYDQAAGGNFADAIHFLVEIPKGTPAYTTAQLKLEEYAEKQQIKDVSAIPSDLSEKQTLNPGNYLQEANSEKINSAKSQKVLVKR